MLFCRTVQYWWSCTAVKLSAVWWIYLYKSWGFKLNILQKFMIPRGYILVTCGHTLTLAAFSCYLWMNPVALYRNPAQLMTFLLACVVIANVQMLACTHTCSMTMYLSKAALFVPESGLFRFDHKLVSHISADGLLDRLRSGFSA